MTHKFAQIKQMYEDSYQCHGDSSASLLTPKGRGELRFRAIEPFLSAPTTVGKTAMEPTIIDEISQSDKKRVLDYGCGLGYLYEFLAQSDYDVDYTGVDILPTFVNACREKYDNKQAATANFRLVQPTEQVKGHYDIVFSSGVFNLISNDSETVSKTYAFQKLEQLFHSTDEVLICDFPSGFVDFKQEHAQHFGVSEVVQFCVSHLTRRFVIRHDLLPYEFTLIAHKNSDIKRPDNCFAVDCGD